MTNQRLFDIVRYMRAEIHNAELITDDEYAELAMEHSAVDRLEDYDELRARLNKLEAAAREFVRKVECGEARSVRSYAAFREALGGDKG